MRTRIAVAFVASLLPAAVIAADDWWFPSKEHTMPSLVADGYKVVGFSTSDEPAPLQNVRANRFVLQKDTSVAMCIEKYPIAGVTPVSTACYWLRR